MRNLLSHILIPALAFAFLLSGNADAAEDAYGLLPRDHQVGSWVMEGPEAFYYDFSLNRILDDRTLAVVDDYEVVQLLSQYYTLDEADIEIRIYEMSSSEQAYGLFSVFADIQPEVEGADIVFDDENKGGGRTVNQEMRVISDDELHLLGDRFFVWVRANQSGHKMDLLLFANKIQTKFDTLGAAIEGVKVLESKDKVFGTERLIGGYDSLGLYFQVGHSDPFLLDEEGVRCLQADYRLEPGKFYRQLVFEYPDEETARSAYKSFTEWTEDYNYLKRLNYADGLGSVVAKTEDGLYIAGFRDGRLLRVFHGLDDNDEVKKVLGSYAGRK